MNIPTTTPSKQKLEFDKKLQQIESDERKLKALEQELTKLQIRMASEATPLVEEFCELRFQNLKKLKNFLSAPYFKKKEKRLIIHYMTELAVGLQAAGDPRAQEFLEELLPREDAEPEEEFSYQESSRYTPPPSQEQETEGKLEIKALFRQLAKAFHPDKEPLEHLKEEKTNLMKKITEAYDNQDLYGLLKLEKEHLAPREFTEDKMELYIKFINDRLKELKAFKARLTKHGPLSTIYRFIYSRKTTILEYNVRNELMKIEEEIQKEKDLQTFLWDRASLRDYLK
jgi:hypothetical protein